jgi:hypothetical protein
MAHRDGYCDRCHQRLPPRPPSVCMWCSRPIEQRPGHGRPRLFCNAGHKHQFETAARRYVHAQLAIGKLKPGDLQPWRMSEEPS